jgi:hypothetical protein
VPSSTRRGEIALALVGLLVGLLLAEGAARLLGRARNVAGGYARVDTDGRERRPINSKGYRDLERAPEPAPGVRRVLCLGDSFTWGASVLFEDAWPQKLERLLTRRRGGAWEAVNLAEPGLNTVQQAQKLVNEGFAYRPDVVVVGYVLNDSEDENAAEARRAEDWVEEARRPPSLLERSALFGVLSSRLRATAENRRRVFGFRSMYEDGYPGWIAAQKALRAIGGACRERGVPLVIAIFPLFGNPLDESYPFADVHAKVAAAAGSAGAQVVDLLPRYRGLRWELLVVDGPRDEHPNEIAQRIAADALADPVADLVAR